MSRPFILPDASPYDLAETMVRDGRPRDVLNQRITVNDTVRIWTVQTGWSSTREFFVRHMLPKWVPAIVTASQAAQEEYASITGAPRPLPRGNTIFSFLLVPQLDEAEQANSQGFLGNDAIEIYKSTTLLITAQDYIVIQEGLANDAIKLVVNDYEIVKIRAGEAGVIYNADAGAEPQPPPP
jgi:hypothetical protein